MGQRTRAHAKWLRLLSDRTCIPSTQTFTGLPACRACCKRSWCFAWCSFSLNSSSIRVVASWPTKCHAGLEFVPRSSRFWRCCASLSSDQVAWHLHQFFVLDVNSVDLNSWLRFFWLRFFRSPSPPRLSRGEHPCPGTHKHPHRTRSFQGLELENSQKHHSTARWTDHG